MENILLELKNLDLNYLILPLNNDFFLQDNTSNIIKNFREITGFTGSNAMVLMGEERSYFFTDFRYFLQAKLEIKKNFEILDIKTFFDFLEEKKFEKLGLIEELSSLFFIEQIKKHSIKFIGIENFFKEKEYSNQKINIFDIKYSGQDSMEKRRNLYLNMRKNNIENIFISDPEDIAWLLNIRGGIIDNTPFFYARAFLLKENQVILFCNLKEDKKLFGWLWNVEVLPLNSIENFLAKNEKLNNILIDEKTINYSLFNLFKNKNIHRNYRDVFIINA